MKKNILFYLLLSLFVSGCSGKWVFPYQSQEDIEANNKKIIQRSLDKVQCYAYQGTQCVVW